MSPQELLAMIVGVSQGYFSVPIFRGLVKALTYSTSLVIGNQVGRFVTSVTALFAFVLASVTFFGLAIAWVLFLAQGGRQTVEALGRAWGQGWFIGLIVFFICAALSKRGKRSLH
jgi:hypothetical protein